MAGCEPGVIDYSRSGRLFDSLGHIRAMPFIRFVSASIAMVVLVIALFFTCWILAAGCSRAHIVVSNRSDITLSNLTISGSCHERHSDALAPQSKWRTVTPYHEGEIYFSFDSAGVSYRTNVGVRTAFLGVFYTIGTNMIIRIETRG